MVNVKSPSDRTPLLEKDTPNARTSCLRSFALVVAIILVAAGMACGITDGLHFVGWWSMLHKYPAAWSAIRLTGPLCFIAAFCVWQNIPESNKPLLQIRSASTATKKRIGDRVQGLINAIGSAEERQRQRVKEEAQAAAAQEDTEIAGTHRDAVFEPPPVQQEAEAEWRIHGMFEHQVLKSGLRHLDESWPEDNIFDLPVRKDGSTASLFAGRGTLVLKLLKGAIQLKSVPVADLNAAQYGLRFLSLRQLLRLRVSHIGFTPAGCGSNVVGTVGGSHEAFLSTIDQHLFEQIGRKALASVVSQNDFFVDNGQLHRYGREAVLLAAAASAIPLPSWWCWWLSPTFRVFFHAPSFTSATQFPVRDGVLEVVDSSKRDPHEPTGRLIWLDWRVHLVTKERELSSTPRHTGASGSRGSETSQDDRVLQLSPGILSETRDGLRETGNLDSKSFANSEVVFESPLRTSSDKGVKQSFAASAQHVLQPNVGAHISTELLRST